MIWAGRRAGGWLCWREVLHRTLVVAALCACGGAPTPPAGHLRFRNQPPVWVVNDRRDVPHRPDVPTFLLDFYHWDARWYRRMDRWLERDASRAVDVNALDEAPDSTWFTNRIGVRDLSAAEIARGTSVIGSPADHLPLVVKSSKKGGAATGFVVVDQRGVKYVLKFEDRGIPEVETGAAIVAQRLFWAAGYNVPEEHLLRLRRGDLELAPDAVSRSDDGSEEPLTAAALDEVLSKVDVRPDGTMRALASQFLPGEPIGGHAREGVRSDDPNDTVPHQHRRALRGARAIAAWLDHMDMKESNTVDSWVEDQADPSVHYVVHYLIDFGKALGAMSYVDCLVKHRRGCRSLAVPGVALTTRDFEPGAWKTWRPSYFPFIDADRFDGFWGAKIVVRFTRDQLRAAAVLGQYSDPRAVDHLVDALVARQRAVARHWFARVNPVDRFEAEAGAGGWTVCFDDLAVKYRLAAASGTRYRARAFDRDGRQTGWRGAAGAASDGRTCLTVAPAAGRDRYTIIELVTERAERTPPALVHVALAPGTGVPHVIGIERR